VSLWWNYETVNNIYSGPLAYRVSGKNGFQFVNGDLDGSSVFQPHLVIWNGSSEASNWDTSSFTLSKPWNTMHHFVWTYDGTTVKLYVDGVNQAVASGTNSGWGSGDGGLTIGKAYAGQTGIIDEVEVSNTALSAAWVAAVYNNQSAPGTFWNITYDQQ